MKRWLARRALGLYPRAWRDRYGEEMRDLLAARPVRIRTVADLCLGAADAWANRRLLAESRVAARKLTPTLPLPGLITIGFTVGSLALLYLWNPGIRHVPSLEGGWAAASASGPLAGLLAWAASAAFDAAAALAALAIVPLIAHALARSRPSPRGGTITVLMAAPVLAVPIGGLLYIQYAMSHFDVGFPVGPLGNAITGGFFAPIALAFGLILQAVARLAPGPSWGARLAGFVHAACGALIACGWLTSAALVALGASGESTRFLVTVAASALCSLFVGVVGAAVSMRLGLRATPSSAGELATT